MPDHAVSADPAVQRQLDRLTMLSPGRDVLGLERITALLDRFGNPQLKLPSAFHVAGTNGKGSTCAFLRAAIEAAGMSVHVYTSPHLVRFNERIRIAGTLISDAELAPLLAEILDRSEDISPSFFEATTAAAFLAFSRAPADACIIEVGLGGRLDATNVIPHPTACGIAQLGIDHQSFLGDRIEDIAAEKAGIARAGVPLVTMSYPRPLADRIAASAAAAGADWLPRGSVWDAAIYNDHLHYRDAEGLLTTSLPRLPGEHQAMNAALAIAMLRHQDQISIPEAALRAATGWADWPARLQRLGDGPLHRLLPNDVELWLDGGHNPAAAEAVAGHFASRQPIRMIVGLLENKDLPGFLAPFGGIASSIHAVPIPGHDHHSPAKIVKAASILGIDARTADSVETALRELGAGSDRSSVLIGGSLYLAGTVLAANGTPPE